MCPAIYITKDDMNNFGSISEELKALQQGSGPFPVHHEPKHLHLVYPWSNLAGVLGASAAHCGNAAAAAAGDTS